MFYTAKLSGQLLNCLIILAQFNKLKKNKKRNHDDFFYFLYESYNFLNAAIESVIVFDDTQYANLT